MGVKSSSGAVNLLAVLGITAALVAWGVTHPLNPGARLPEQDNGVRSATPSAMDLERMAYFAES